MSDEKKSINEEQAMANNNMSREMTDEELEKIVGGYIPTHGHVQQQQHVPGICCPICGNTIPISIQQLLFARALSCPTCGLTLYIDKRKSEKALQILAKVDEAMSRLKK